MGMMGRSVMAFGVVQSGISLGHYANLTIGG